MINVQEYIYNCEKMINDSKMHYLYGYKGETITQALNNSLRSQYPNVWTYSYLTKANQWIGDKAIDCSGFVQKNCGGSVEIGSYYMGEKWGEAPFSSQNLTGLIGWRSGHVVVLSGKTQNGMIEIMEASGQKTGLRKRWANPSEFKKLLINPLVNYNSNKYKIGWNRDDKGWWFSPEGSTYLSDGYYKVVWSKNPAGDWFYFDKNGYCIITNSDGVVLEPLQ